MPEETSHENNESNRDDSDEWRNFHQEQEEDDVLQSSQTTTATRTRSSERDRLIRATLEGSNTRRNHTTFAIENNIADQQLRELRAQNAALREQLARAQAYAQQLLVTATSSRRTLETMSSSTNNNNNNNNNNSSSSSNTAAGSSGDGTTAETASSAAGNNNAGRRLQEAARAASDRGIERGNNNNNNNSGTMDDTSVRAAVTVGIAYAIEQSRNGNLNLGPAIRNDDVNATTVAARGRDVAEAAVRWEDDEYGEEEVVIEPLLPNEDPPELEELHDDAYNIMPELVPAPVAAAARASRNDPARHYYSRPPTTSTQGSAAASLQDEVAARTHLQVHAIVRRFTEQGAARENNENVQYDSDGDVIPEGYQRRNAPAPAPGAAAPPAVNVVPAPNATTVEVARAASNARAVANAPRPPVRYVPGQHYEDDDLLVDSDGDVIPRLIRRDQMWNDSSDEDSSSSSENDSMPGLVQRDVSSGTDDDSLDEPPPLMSRRRVTRIRAANNNNNNSNGNGNGGPNIDELSDDDSSELDDVPPLVERDQDMGDSSDDDSAPYPETRPRPPGGGFTRGFLATAAGPRFARRSLGRAADGTQDNNGGGGSDDADALAAMVNASRAATAMDGQSIRLQEMMQNAMSQFLDGGFSLEESRRRRMKERTVKCPVCSEPYLDYEESDHPNRKASRKSDKHACSHGATALFIKLESCPICFEDDVEPPNVALACGHVICPTCFPQLGGIMGPRPEGKPPPLDVPGKKKSGRDSASSTANRDSTSTTTGGARETGNGNLNRFGTMHVPPLFRRSLRSSGGLAMSVPDLRVGDEGSPSDSETDEDMPALVSRDGINDDDSDRPPPLMSRRGQRVNDSSDSESGSEDDESVPGMPGLRPGDESSSDDASSSNLPELVGRDVMGGSSDEDTSDEDMIPGLPDLVARMMGGSSDEDSSDDDYLVPGLSVGDDSSDSEGDFEVVARRRRRQTRQGGRAPWLARANTNSQRSTSSAVAQPSTANAAAQGATTSTSFGIRLPRLPRVPQPTSAATSAQGPTTSTSTARPSAATTATAQGPTTSTSTAARASTSTQASTSSSTSGNVARASTVSGGVSFRDMLLQGNQRNSGANNGAPAPAAYSSAAPSNAAPTNNTENGGRSSSSSTGSAARSYAQALAAAPSITATAVSLGAMSRNGSYTPFPPADDLTVAYLAAQAGISQQQNNEDSDEEDTSDIETVD